MTHLAILLLTIVVLYRAATNSLISLAQLWASLWYHSCNANTHVCCFIEHVCKLEIVCQGPACLLYLSEIHSIQDYGKRYVLLQGGGGYFIKYSVPGFST